MNEFQQLKPIKDFTPKEMMIKKEVDFQRYYSHNYQIILEN